MESEKSQRAEVCREIQPCLDTIEEINQERLLVNAELEVLEARGWIQGDMYLSEGTKA